MKIALVALVFFSTTSAFAGVNCTVTDTQAKLINAPMVKSVRGANTFFNYASLSTEAEVSTNADLSSAFVRIGSLVATPKQQVSAFVGKDAEGLVNMNADINGATVIVECQYTP